MAVQALFGEGRSFEGAENKKKNKRKNHNSVLTPDGVYVFHFVYEDKCV